MSGYFENKFKPVKNVQRGLHAKSMGDLFENMLRNACIKERVEFTRIPDGCRMVRTRSGAVLPKRTTTPFDFLLTHKGLAAALDCKTVDSGNFSYSMLTMHQVQSLIKIYDSEVVAGYVVWFRDIDKVVFYTAHALYHLKRRESLKPEVGIMLGSSSNFSVKAILNSNNPNEDMVKRIKNEND